MKLALVFFSKIKIENQHTQKRFQKFVKTMSPRFQSVGSQTIHTSQLSKAIITQQLSKLYYLKNYF
jgi:hypothetical protein